MDDIEIIDATPGVRLGVIAELERAALERSAQTGRPVIVAGFTSADRARVVDVELAEGDQQLVPISHGTIRIDRGQIRQRVERVLQRVLVTALRRMPD